MRKFIFIIAFFSLLIIHCSLIIANAQWIQQNSGLGTMNNINDVQFINSNTGLFCTSYEPYPGTVHGELFKTTNGGTNWNMIFSDYHKKITEIYFVDENTGFAIMMPYVNYTYLHHFCRTTNGGINWDTLYYNSDMYDMYFINASSGWGAGATYIGSGNYTGRLFKTTTGGNNWTSSSYPNFMLNCIQFLNGNTGFASGYKITGSTYKTIILKTTNGGNNWVLNDSSFSFQGYSLSFSDTNTGYIAGLGGNVIKTTNGGESWVMLSSGTSSDIKSVCFKNSNRGWIATYGGSIHYTSNGGVNWTQQYSMSSYHFNSVFFVNLYKGWVVGDNGIILTTTNGGSVLINEIISRIPDNYFLFQNYPNPFNPITKIKFDLPKSNLTLSGAKGLYVQLKVYDILGKKIQTLVNEQLQPGTYEVTFDGSNLPSGVYFYKLSAGNYTETKKLVLLK